MAAVDNAPRYSDEIRKQYRDAGYWTDTTLPDVLAEWVAKTPDAPFIKTPDVTLSYAEVHAAARRFANSLLDLGLKRQDVVGIQMPNTPEYLIALFGVTMMGGVLCTMHMPYRSGEIEPLLRHGDAKAVICTAPMPNHDAPATMAGLRDKIDTLEHILVNAEDPPEGMLSLPKMIADGSDAEIADPPRPEDFCLLCFTSGTSAAPKGVMRTHESFTCNGRYYSPTIAMTSDDLVLTAPPFTHVFGLCCVNSTLAQGGCNLLMPLFTPENLADRLINGKPTVVYAAPAHLAATMKAGLLEGADLSSIREVCVAGAVCPPEVAAAFERYLPNGEVGQLFGMTEIILVAQTPLGEDDPRDRHESTGRAIPGVEFRITGPDGEVLGTGEEGEYEVRGHSILAGYVNNPEANAKAFSPDGWFKTGDLATIDAKGNVTITGRVKDLINRGGIKINPTDVENAVMAHDDVVLAAVVPMPDDVMGEKACCFAMLKPGTSLDLDTLTAHLEANGIAKMRWPERLEIIEDMPMTPTKKIIKGELIAML